jgi:hypothetical protein
MKLGAQKGNMMKTWMSAALITATVAFSGALANSGATAAPQPPHMATFGKHEKIATDISARRRRHHHSHRHIYMAGIAVMERDTRSRTSARIICNRSIREIRMATADMVVISRLITEARTMAVLSGDLVGATVTAAALAIVTTALVTAVATTAAILATAEVATDMDIDK